MSESHDDHAGPSFQMYMTVFYALCVFTGLSFVFNEMARHEIISHTASVVAIVIVAIAERIAALRKFISIEKPLTPTRKDCWISANFACTPLSCVRRHQNICSTGQHEHSPPHPPCTEHRPSARIDTSP